MAQAARLRRSARAGARFAREGESARPRAECNTDVALAMSARNRERMRTRTR